MLRSACVLAAMLPVAASAADSPNADDLKKTLVDLETQSWVAWKSHDGAFFQRFLSEDHIEMSPGGPGGKAPVVAGVAGGGCTVASYAIDHFTLTIFSADTALLTYHAAQDTTCGKVKVPSPVWASSLYVLRDGRWQNALYQHVTIPSP